MIQPIDPAAFAADAVREDRFLNGTLRILQPLDGYRAATDPIFLASAVPARPGQSVLELGCGAGVALLALGRRVPGLVLVGVERQAAYADLARRNATLNGLSARIVTTDLAMLPADLRAQAFDHVMMNPPYFATGDPAARDPGRAQARREETPLDGWIDAGLKRLKPGGHLCIVHRAERLPALLRVLEGRASVRVRPLAARQGRAAGRVLVLARKGARSPFALLAPLVLHQGATHPGDHDHFTDAAQVILRDGAALGWE